MEEKSEKNKVIRLFNVNKRFGSIFALKDITLDIEEGEFLFINGPTGAGKSTLLKLLYLAVKPSEGQILVDGMNLARISRSRLSFMRRKFGMIFQDFKLISNRSVYDNVSLVLEAAGEKPAYIKKKVMHVLRTTGMEQKVNAYPAALSGGEQQRVAVARALVGNPSIILADEPTGSLDTETAQSTMDFIMEYHEKGATVLVASHDLHLVNCSDKARSIYLEEGMIKKTATLL